MVAARRGSGVHRGDPRVFLGKFLYPEPKLARQGLTPAHIPSYLNRDDVLEQITPRLAPKRGAAPGSWLQRRFAALCLVLMVSDVPTWEKAAEELGLPSLTANGYLMGKLAIADLLAFREGLLRPGPVPGPALHRDPAAPGAGHGPPRGLRRHRCPTAGTHRHPGTAARRPSRQASRRPRADPAVRPRGQTPARRRPQPTRTTRPHRPMAPVAAPPPGTIPLVPQTRTPGTQLRPGQLAIDCCRTSRISQRGPTGVPGVAGSVSRPVRRVPSPRRRRHPEEDIRTTSGCRGTPAQRECRPRSRGINRRTSNSAVHSRLLRN
jgi:hypothetical protein